LKAALEALAARHWWRPRATWLTCLLWPLSQLYRLLFALRGGQQQPLPVAVLVVGNLVVGGAGKTPTVIALVQALVAAGHRPGVISRGHGRDGTAALPVLRESPAAEVGDEPLLIARRSGVPVWVGRDRVATARALLAAHPAVDLIVSDDGLQHVGLPRQAEVVVFDERGAGNGWLLPAGPLREPMPATLPPSRQVLYTAGRASTPLPGHVARRRLTLAWPLDAWHGGDATRAVPLATLRGRPLHAAAGLAAPSKFFAMLREVGLAIDEHPLPDHFAWRTLPWPADARDALVTEKDAVKLAPARCGAAAVWVLPLDLDLPADLVAELLRQLHP